MLNERLRRVIATSLGLQPEEVDSEASPKNLMAWDSIGHLKLVLELEEEFGIRFRSSEIRDLNSGVRIQAALERLKAL